MSESAPEIIIRKIGGINPVYILTIFFLLLTGVKIILSGLIISPQIFEDELFYDLIAKQIYTGSLFTGSQPYPQGPFPPGYSFFISPAFSLTSDKYLAYHYMLIINAIITSTILFPAFYLLRSVTSRHIALCGAFLISLLPSVTMNTFVLMSEALFIPLFLFSIWFAYRSLSYQNPCFWDTLLGLSIFFMVFSRAAGWSAVIGVSGTIIWMIMRREIVLNQIFFRKMAGIAAPGILLSLIWTANQLVTKGGLPSGYSPSHYVSLFGEAATKNPGHLIYVTLLHIDYILLASLIILPVFTIIFGYSYFIRFKSCETDRSGAGTYQKQRLSSSPVVIYTGISALIIFAFGIVHMSNLSYDVSLCGRYMDPIIPVIVLGGILGLHSGYKQDLYRQVLVSGSVYLLVLFAITSLVMLSFPHQPNNNVGIYFLYSLTQECVLPLLSLGLGLVFFVGCVTVVRLRKGIVPLILLFTLIVAIMTIPIFFFETDSSMKTGSLLPFCQDVNALCDSSGSILWDTSSDSTEWDQMVYYTMKFWLGEKIHEISTSEGTTKDDKNTWVITKRKENTPVITYSEYRVIPRTAFSS